MLPAWPGPREGAASHSCAWEAVDTWASIQRMNSSMRRVVLARLMIDENRCIMNEEGRVESNEEMAFEG